MCAPKLHRRFEKPLHTAWKSSSADARMAWCCASEMNEDGEGEIARCRNGLREFGEKQPDEVRTEDEVDEGASWEGEGGGGGEEQGGETGG